MKFLKVCTYGCSNSAVKMRRGRRSFLELSLQRRLSLVPMDARARRDGDHRPSRRCDTPGVQATLDPSVPRVSNCWSHVAFVR